jgi:hypothetical protein
MSAQIAAPPRIEIENWPLRILPGKKRPQFVWKKPLNNPARSGKNPFKSGY